MLSIVNDLVLQYQREKVAADPRTKDWLLIANNPVPVWILTALYLAFVIMGPRFMKNRAAFELQWFLILYNLGLVVLSVYMFVEIILSIWDAGYDLFCAKYNGNSRHGAKELRVARVLWWYFISKAIELMDTVLMVLRKKFDQISFLHVFHHASMLNIWWWVMMFIPGGQSWFGSMLNCLVHIVMYAYYTLSAIPYFKGKLWWKKYITKFQLIQFVITFSHTFNSLYFTTCDFPRWGQNLLASYMVFMIILFGNFYIQAYIRRKRLGYKKEDTKRRNGLSTNGYVNHAGGDNNGHIHSKGE
ncbi:elongation of very long chain fatty acids protein 2 [Patella vulgata]|uniref:elongation of very long chain fatty acids protein 2 n=1 Tax=Patella vulgata TaxID=6465 RepID=UPI00218016E9|nr:elongation of very long chain fatty acids protein 2 [Patella vulgata]